MDSERSEIIANVVGFSIFGLAARFGQLGIQRRHLFHNPMGHLISMGAFGVVGYWAHVWDKRAAELIAVKRAEIADRRKRQLAAAEEASSAVLAETQAA